MRMAVRDRVTAFKKEAAWPTRAISISMAVASAIFLSIILSIGAANASYEELDSFDEGYEYYLSYQPEKAIESFHMFLGEFPESSARDAVLFWLGRSFSMLKRYDDAKLAFLSIRQAMPDSPFLTYANTELATLPDHPPEKDTGGKIEQIASDAGTPSDQQEETNLTLPETVAERDALKALLIEEQDRNRVLEEKVNRIDRELKDILLRLQSIQAVRKDDPAGHAIPLNQRNKPDPANEEVSGAAAEAIHEATSTESSVRQTAGEAKDRAETFPAATRKNIAINDAPSHILELVAIEETWISVTIDDDSSRERLLKPGARVRLTAKNGFLLKIGNAGGTRVIYNGKEIGPLGERGKVAKLKLPNVRPPGGRKDPSSEL